MGCRPAVCRERTIALFRTSDSFLVQARGWLPNAVGGVVWYGPHAAHTTVYVPVLVGMAASPPSLSYGWQGVHNATTLFWAARDVSSVAQARFSLMIKDIRSAQAALEARSAALLLSLTRGSSSSSDGGNGRGGGGGGDYDDITRALSANAAGAVTAYGELLRSLLFKYADGFINQWVDGTFTSPAAGERAARSCGRAGGRAACSFVRLAGQDFQC